MVMHALDTCAAIIRLVGDFDLAEDAAQEGFAAAVDQWPASGVFLERRLRELTPAARPTP
jgi:predicted RNA polymerase sigma factor